MAVCESGGSEVDSVYRKQVAKLEQIAKLINELEADGHDFEPEHNYVHFRSLGSIHWSPSKRCFYVVGILDSP
jgi:hypothetical protein